MLQPSATSPMRSAGASSHSNSPITPEPSPVSPRGDWHTHSTLLPSPVASSMPMRLPGTANSWAEQAERPAGTSRSNPENAIDFVAIPPASFQRTTVDYSKVVCLGPLPDSLQQSQRDTLITRLTGPGGRGVSNSLFKASSRASEGSLGSNFTEEEEMIAEELTRQASSSQANPPRRDGVSTNRSSQELSSLPFDDTGSAKKHRGLDSVSTYGKVRLDPGRDLIHVPQLADKRYSWEDQ
ncbi:Eukaryotic aspartyl protease family protein [Ophiocordyceps sinensis CO18]|uniref:Eukaryotic aspartyl protease family protein n=1 Tax=Ophiocordyceps sinensis (strain Co18 / CGMCC 3.14243) TaxID=911162 RepID=T5AGW3_OPHSC|nr:Eukaryotic aspartyl protease family protein [Ophiocordyceps sinensis CO18]